MKRFFVWILVAVIFFFAGCADQPPLRERDGRLYGRTQGLFSFKWWDYYERGASLAEGGFYEEALADFAEALKQRESDQWRSRTYGMHFIDYFPHRERGIVFFRLERHEEAEAELEKSLMIAESARAKYFLNLVRRVLIEKSGKDTGPPRVSIDHPSSGSIVNSFEARVSGVVEDDTFVSGVGLGDVAFPLELSSPRYSFLETVPLQEGENDITVVATDITGKRSARTTRIVADRQGPAVSIHGYEQRGIKGVLHFSVSDRVGITRISVNGMDVAVPPGTKTMDLDEEAGEESLRITAVDMAGNATTATVAASELTARPPRYALLASLGRDGIVTAPAGAAVAGHAGLDHDCRPPFSSSVPLWKKGAKVFPVYRQGNSHGRPWPEQLLSFLDSDEIRDSDPPRIAIPGMDEVQETYNDNALIEMEVTDASFIQSLTVNGEEVMERSGRKLFVSVLKKLAEGKNTFLVAARDIHGNSSSHAFSITRKVHVVRQVGSRMSIAILPMERTGEATWFADTLGRRLASAFVNQKRFRVVEREGLDQILLEQKLTTASLVDPREALRLGRLIAADAMLAGAIVETPTSLEIITYMVDTETAVILAANDVYGEDKSHAAFNHLLKVLAHKYENDFPLLEGEIIARKEGNILVSLGRDEKVKELTKLICFREGPEIISSVSGRPLGREVTELGMARVVGVLEDHSRAEIVRQDQPLLEHDKVITK